MRKPSTSCKVAFVLLLVHQASCFAAGLFLYEIATTNSGFASAGWSSRAEDPSTLFTNPAGMTRLKGQQIELGLEAIYSHIYYKQNAATTVEGTNGDGRLWLPSGSFFYTHPVKNKIALGIGALGYFGAELKFNHNWVGRYYLTNAVLEAFSLVPAAAVQVTPSFSVGVGLNLMYGIFYQKSAVNNRLDSEANGSLTLEDQKTSPGAVIGLLWEMSPRSRIGLQYLSQVHLPFSAKPHFHEIGPLLKAAIGRTGVDQATVNLGIRVPQSLILSGYHRFSPHFASMLDVGFQEWSKFERITVVLSEPTSTTLVVKNHYRDCWHIAAGVEYNPTPKSRFSLGGAYDSSPVSNEHRPINFPVGKQIRIGAGAGHNFTKRFKADFCYELSWSGDLPSNVDTGSLPGNVSGEYKNVYAMFFNLNFRWILGSLKK